MSCCLGLLGLLDEEKVSFSSFFKQFSVPPAPLVPTEYRIKTVLDPGLLNFWRPAENRIEAVLSCLMYETSLWLK